jgi:hypothetical protein
MDRILLRRANLAAFCTAILAALIVGCGGGGGTVGGNPTSSTSATTATTTTGTTTTSSSSTTGSLPSNSILFSVNSASSSASTYSIVALNASTGVPTIFLPNIPVTTSLVAQNPIVPKQFIFAANAGDKEGSLVGIYSNTTLSTSGAKTIAAPKFGSIASLSVTADGKNMVFTAFDPTNSFPYLYAVSSSGGAPVQLDGSSSSSVSPADSDTIVYSNDADGFTYQLFTRSLSKGTAGTATQVTTGVLGDSLNPTFSRDGTQIAYQFTNYTTNLTTLNVLNLPGRTTTNLPDANLYQPYGQTFSSDGSTLAILGGSGNKAEILTQPVSSSSKATVLYSTSNSGSSAIKTGAGLYWTTADGKSVGGRTAGSGGMLGSFIRRVVGVEHGLRAAK